MAWELREVAINVPAEAPRHEVSRSVPAGTVVLGVIQFPGQGARVVVRLDPAGGSPVDRYLVAVQARVELTTREAQGTYLGSFSTYVRARGAEADVYHLFEVAAP